MSRLVSRYSEERDGERERKNKADMAKCEHFRNLGETIQEYGFSFKSEIMSKKLPKTQKQQAVSWAAFGSLSGA